MKNFITAEEFLKLPKEYQTVIINWWKPTVGDLWFDIHNENEIRLVTSELDISYIEKYKIVISPLLQLHHLIKFIEDKTEGQMDIMLDSDGYELTVRSKKKGLICYSDLECDLFDALWQVVTIVAQGV